MSSKDESLPPKDIKEAMRIINEKALRPTHIHVGKESAEAMGFPHAGFWVLEDGEYVCKESYE